MCLSINYSHDLIMSYELWSYEWVNNNEVFKKLKKSQS
jgi:hypothetical protein